MRAWLKIDIESGAARTPAGRGERFNLRVRAARPSVVSPPDDLPLSRDDGADQRVRRCPACAFCGQLQSFIHKPFILCADASHIFLHPLEPMAKLLFLR